MEKFLTYSNTLPLDNGSTIVELPNIGNVRITVNADGTLSVKVFCKLTPEELHDIEVQNTVACYDNRFQQSGIAISFEDYKGIPIKDLDSDEQANAFDEITNALISLPFRPNDICYLGDDCIATWQIPHERQFMNEKEWLVFCENVLKYAATIGIATPIIIEMDNPLGNFEDTDNEKFEYYKYVLTPLEAFDKAFGLSLTVREI